MNRIGLALAGLRHYWRTDLAVLGGTAVGSAVLVGALGVGDSVRASLAARASAHSGRAELAIEAGDRFFGADLGARVEEELAGARCAPLLVFRGVAATPDGRARASGITLVGADARFFALAPGAPPPVLPAPGEALINRALASRLDLAVGDALVVRVPRPSALSRDLALAPTEDAVLGLSVRVIGICDAPAFGDYSLRGGARVENCFVLREWLAGRLERAGRANVLLAAGEAGQARLETEAIQSALARAFALEDAELHWREDEERAFVELASRRVLLDGPVVRAIERLGEPALGIFTYFVNSIEAGGRATPYSTVTAVGPLADGAELAQTPALDFAAIVPPDLASEEIVLTDWLATDLGVSAGEQVELVYFAPQSERRLEERRTAFRVRSIVPLEPPASDPSLMPDFPGISDSAHCRDWEPGVPIDLGRIRAQDEQWWEERRGTPKAFLALSAARERFASRFGELTAVRFPLAAAERVRAGLARELRPADAGLFFRELGSGPGGGGQSANDFGGLFLGLSSFLVLAAALLTALGFGFGVESRAREIGTLRALGFAPRSIAALFLLEALPLALLGSFGGAFLGLAGTRVLLFGLATIWSGAIGGAHLAFHVDGASIAGGALASILVAVVAMALALRKLVARPVPELLASRSGFLEREARALEKGAAWSKALAALGLLAVGALFTMSRSASGPEQALLHFGAGGALLVLLLAASRMVLARTLRSSDPARLSLARMGVRNAARRPGRSLAIAALLAAVLFLLATLAVHQRRSESAGGRSSGTGGFALLGRTALPLHHPLASPESREELGLGEEDLAGVHALELAVHEGDDASCLELAAPTRPELLGVDAGELALRGAFTFAEHEGEGDASPWLMLDLPRADGALAAIGDQATIAWQLHRSVGDEIEYVDEHGRPFRVRLVGALADSVLQGSLVVSRAGLRERFPSESGSRAFFLDVEGGDPGEVSARLTKKLSDVGLELEPAVERLATLRAVQDTYLEVFQVLSALGLVLGSLGLGLLVLRNGLERRGEYALLQALGYERRTLFTTIASEHLWLFAAGVLSGTLAALATVVPSIADRGIGAPSGPALVLFALALAAGALSIAVASSWALRSLDPRILRQEA